MITDLHHAPAPDTTVDCDVVIIGAGVAGSLMADALSKRGLRVVVLESGARHQEQETHPLNAVVQTGQIYAGAEHGRFRGLGGTSTRWGGAMIPFLSEDLGPHTAGWPADWPVDLDSVIGFLPEVERAFALPQTSYETPEYVQASSGSPLDFQVRAPKWPPFKLRNVANTFAATLESAQGPQVWLNSTVTDIALNAAGEARAVRASGQAGQILSVNAGHVVVAAGTIESTRLLLRLDADHDGQVFGKDDVIGRYFHDHLSAPVARVNLRDKFEPNRLIGFRFEGAAMRSTRFELAGKARVRQHLPGAFAHIGFRTTGRSGFDGLREILRSLQKRRLPAVGDAHLLLRNSGWFARAGWQRYVNNQVLPPDDALYELHMVTEQVPDPNNRITLSPDQRDRFGLPLASIHWQVSDADISVSQRIQDAFADYWAQSSLANLGSLDRYPKTQWVAELVSGGGIYHPGGSLRMGADRSSGVVDGGMRCFAIPNLHAVTTAAFPSGGGANPTMMLMLFALRAADDIAVSFKSQS